MKKYLSLLFVISIPIALLSCRGNKGNVVSDSDTDSAPEELQITTTQKDTSITDKVRNAKSVDEVKRNIDGTVWHYTENLDDSEIGCWIKVEFNNGKYTTYYALPSEGEWTMDKSGSYELKEGRYSNTGKKYISIHWEGKIKNPQLGITLPCEMSLTTDDLCLRVHSPEMDAVLYDGNGLIKQIIMKGQMEFGNYSWN